MSDDVRLPKFMKGDLVKTLDTGEGWKKIQRVIPKPINEEMLVFQYELTGGIIVGEESVTELHQEGEY